jgi:hypothetical protein
MDYQVHNSRLIVENHEQMVSHAIDCHGYYSKAIGGDSSWNYSKYNFFCLSSPSQLYHELFWELKSIINDFVPEHKYRWMQCWLNCHHPSEVDENGHVIPLDWHTHEWDYHGYIAIDPKGTRTVFHEYEVVNQVGNIYIGPGYREHHVVVDKEYSTPRITLGFDIMVQDDDDEFRLVDPHDMFSLMPI